MSHTKKYIVHAAKFTSRAFSRRTGKPVSSKRTLLLLGVVNLLVGANVWAQVYAPTGLTASSVTASSVTLNWADSSTKGGKSVIVSRSLLSGSGYTDLATLPAYQVNYTYTDAGLQS